MRKFIAFLPAIALNLALAAQKTVPAFGEIDPADLKLRSCSFEPDAPAMKLFDVQEIEFEPSLFEPRITTEKRVRIKIFNESGYKYASVQIPYYNKKKSTRIKDLEGIIYSIDNAGKISAQKLTEDDFFKQNAEKNVDVISFTFPNLRPGSVIEYRYKKVEKEVLEIDSWIAQGEIPAAYTSSILVFPENSRLYEKVFGADTIEKRTEQFKRGATEFERILYSRENLPSFQKEPFMSSYQDNVLTVAFVTIPQGNFAFDILRAPESLWKYYSNILMKSPLFGGQIRVTIPGTKSIIDSARSVSSTSDRIRLIYEAVKKRIPERTEQTIYPGNLIDAWNSRAANSAEINLVLLNLLKKSGVQCFPILVSTRENGKVSMDFPSIGQMNNIDVLASDGDKVYVLDASLKFQSPRTPPFNALNRNAYLLDETGMRWIWIDDARPLIKRVVQIHSLLKEDGTIEGSAYSTHYDYAKSYMLDSTNNNPGSEDYIDKIPPGLNIISVTTENADDDNEPLLQKTEFSFESQRTGDFYFINPLFFSSKKSNPFLRDTRKTDIDFGCNQESTLRINLGIPATLQVDFLPKNIIVRAPDTSFIFKRIVFSDAESISLQQSFEIRRPVFNKEEYKALREFFTRVYTLMNEEIVLKKKK